MEPSLRSCSCGDLDGYYSDGLLGSADTLMVAVCASMSLAIMTCASLCSSLRAPPQYPGNPAGPLDGMRRALLH